MIAATIIVRGQVGVALLLAGIVIYGAQTLTRDTAVTEYRHVQEQTGMRRQEKIDD